MRRDGVELMERSKNGGRWWELDGTEWQEIREASRGS